MMTRATVAVIAFSAAAAAAVVASAVVQRAVDSDAPSPPGLQTAVTPTAAFDDHDRLWLTWVEDSHVLVSTSADQGRTFAPPVRVTPAPESVDANGEARPKIALGRRGEVFVSWTRRGAGPFTGDIRFAVSRDGGHLYSAPITINDDGLDTAHRFDSLHVNRAGHVYIVWIDKRDMERARAGGDQYVGAALYYTVSTDGGRTFQANRKIKDNVCECCRLAIDIDADDRPVLVWRDVIDGTTRDHAIVRFDSPISPGAPRRATSDGWNVDACPHHGPSLSIGDDGVYHMVWFTGDGPDGPGSFYARSTDGGGTFSRRVRVAAADTLGHAVVLSRGSQVVVAWKGATRDGGKPVFVMESNDAGLTWQPARAVAWAKQGSDHPFLLKGSTGMFLSWWSSAEGYRLFALNERAGTARDADRQTSRTSATTSSGSSN